MSKDPVILVVEDNDVSRDLMRSILEAQDYQVVTAVDGEEALSVVESTDVDLAYVDLNMEPMGGFEFIKHLREHNENTHNLGGKKYLFPIVIVTADESSDVLILAQEHGAVQLFKKPVDPARLLHTTEKLLR